MSKKFRRYLDLMSGKTLEDLEGRYETDKSLRHEVNEERWSRIKACVGTIVVLATALVVGEALFPEKKP
jgi:hypothetical protein